MRHYYDNPEGENEIGQDLFWETQLLLFGM